MKRLEYKRYWYFPDGYDKVEGTIVDLVLDIPYFMNSTGVIPPLSVLNEEFEKGGSKGGISPGTL